MTRRLPPFHSLRTFEAAANHLSFTKAADELHITQSAVSQQIRQLEDQLGRKLFHRMPRSLALTDDGRRLLEGVHSALQQLRDTMDDLERLEHLTRLIITVLPSFGSKWLVPRLHRFLQQHPNIRITVLPSAELVDFNKEDIDVGLRWGHGPWPNVESHRIIEETLFPVCSPSFFASHRIGAGVDLTTLPLIGDVTHDMWRRWFDANGVELNRLNHSTRYDDAGNMIQAAIDGQGVALARSVLVLDELTSGRLVQVMPQVVRSPYAYHLVYPERLAHETKVKAFHRWLKVEAAESRRSLQLYQSSLPQLVAADHAVAPRSG